MESAVPALLLASAGSSVASGFVGAKNAKLQRKQFELQEKAAKLSAEQDIVDLNNNFETLRSTQRAQFIANGGDVNSASFQKLQEEDLKSLNDDIRRRRAGADIEVAQAAAQRSQISTVAPVIGGVTGATRSLLTYKQGVKQDLFKDYFA